MQKRETSGGRYAIIKYICALRRNAAERIPEDNYTRERGEPFGQGKRKEEPQQMETDPGGCRGCDPCGAGCPRRDRGRMGGGHR